MTVTTVSQSPTECVIPLFWTATILRIQAFRPECRLGLQGLVFFQYLFGSLLCFITDVRICNARSINTVFIFTIMPIEIGRTNFSGFSGSPRERDSRLCRRKMTFRRCLGWCRHHEQLQTLESLLRPDGSALLPGPRRLGYEWQPGDASGVTLNVVVGITTNYKPYGLQRRGWDPTFWMNIVWNEWWKNAVMCG